MSATVLRPSILSKPSSRARLESLGRFVGELVGAGNRADGSEFVAVGGDLHQAGAAHANADPVNLVRALFDRVVDCRLPFQIDLGHVLDLAVAVDAGRVAVAAEVPAQDAIALGDEALGELVPDSPVGWVRVLGPVHVAEQDPGVAVAVGLGDEPGAVGRLQDEWIVLVALGRQRQRHHDRERQGGRTHRAEEGHPMVGQQRLQLLRSERTELAAGVAQETPNAFPHRQPPIVPPTRR